MTRARSVARLGNSQALSVDSSFNVGVNSTSPVEKLNVVGVVSATSFHGSGTNLTSLSATNLSGTLPALNGSNLTNLSAANLSGTLPALNGSNLTDLNGSSIASGTVAAARVATLNQNTTGTAGGLTGTPDITVRNIVGTAATFTGVLTYEDVTNVDSIGIVTARGGLTTQKLLKEEVNVTAGKLSDNLNIYLENGCVHIFTTAESTTSTPAIKYSSGVNLKDKMSVGESVVVTLITTANASAYSANITIDGDAVTENWIGGSAPSDGGSSGVDVHTFTIIKVASSGTTDQQLTVIANHSKTS